MSFDGASPVNADISRCCEPSEDRHSAFRAGGHIICAAGRVLLALVGTTRPLSSLVAGTLSASVVIAAQGRLSAISVAAGFAMTILTMFGFVMNDVMDFDKDARAGVRRPIAMGRLSRTGAVFFASALLLSVYLISPAGGWGGIVLAFTGVALVAYSPLAQRFPLGKGLYVALLCCAPLLYGSMVGGVRRSWLSYATLASFVLGREALMDSDELIGDSGFGMETIAAILGRRPARQIGITAMLSSAVLLLGIERGSIGRLAATATLLSLTFVFLWPGLSDGRRIHLSRFPMLTGAVAIACGAS